MREYYSIDKKANTPPPDSVLFILSKYDDIKPEKQIIMNQIKRKFSNNDSSNEEIKKLKSKFYHINSNYDEERYVMIKYSS